MSAFKKIDDYFYADDRGIIYFCVADFLRVNHLPDLPEMRDAVIDDLLKSAPEIPILEEPRINRCVNDILQASNLPDIPAMRRLVIEELRATDPDKLIQGEPSGQREKRHQLMLGRSFLRSISTKCRSVFRILARFMFGPP